MKALWKHVFFKSFKCKPKICQKLWCWKIHLPVGCPKMALENPWITKSFLDVSSKIDPFLIAGSSRGAHPDPLRPDLPAGQERDAVWHRRSSPVEDRVRQPGAVGEQPHGVGLERRPSLQHACRVRIKGIVMAQDVMFSSFNIIHMKKGRKKGEGELWPNSGKAGRKSAAFLVTAWRKNENTVIESGEISNS